MERDKITGKVRNKKVIRVCLLATTILILCSFSASANENDENKVDVSTCVDDTDSANGSTNEVNWEAMKDRSVNVTYTGCPRFFGLIASVTKVKQHVSSGPNFRRFKSTLLADSELADIASLAYNVPNGATGIWVFRVAARWQRLFVNRNLAETTATDLIIDLKAAYPKLVGPQNLYFIRLNLSQDIPLGPLELSLFEELKSLYSYSTIGVHAQRANNEGLAFWNNRELRTPAFMMEYPSPEARLLMIEEARSKARISLGTTLQRLKQPDFVKELSAIVNISSLRKRAEEALLRIDRTVPKVSRETYDYSVCAEDSVIAMVQMELDRSGDRPRFVPANRKISFCQTAFTQNFSLGDLTVTYLHENFHQVGIVNEKTATILSNIVFIVANGKKVDNPGYSRVYPMTDLWEQAIQITQKFFPDRSNPN